MSPIALITGANRGIGYETCRQLSRHDITIILTSRDAEAGEAATQRLRTEDKADVRFHPLDVSQPGQIDTLKKYLEREFGRLDILVNNAGVFLEESAGDPQRTSFFNTDPALIRATLDVNLFGPVQLCQALIPLMRKNNYGRVVNVSSGMGQLAEMNGHYPGYRISKTALNAVTRICADELNGTNILVNSACPGWVRTRMGGSNATRTVEAGADTIVWLATLPDGGPSGQFFRDRKVLAW